MRTVTTVRIVTETRELSFGFWDSENEQFVPVDDNNIDTVATTLNCSRELLGALVMLVESITLTIGKDLIDIWRRLDAMQKDQDA
jgi:hypothetical protein